MDSVYCDMFRLCNIGKYRSSFEKFVLETTFDEGKDYSVIKEPLLYMLLYQDNTAKNIMFRADKDMYMGFFPKDCEKYLIDTVHEVPKWIETITWDTNTVYECLLYHLPRNGFVNMYNNDALNGEKATSTFLTLLYSYGYILNKFIFQNKDAQKRFKSIIMYIAQKNGLYDFLKDKNKIRYRKKETCITDEGKYYNIKIVLNFLRTLPYKNIQDLIEKEGDDIRNLYTAAYYCTPLDWEFMEDENQRFISGIDQAALLIQLL